MKIWQVQPLPFCAKIQPQESDIDHRFCRQCGKRQISKVSRLALNKLACMQKKSADWHLANWPIAIATSMMYGIYENDSASWKGMSDPHTHEIRHVNFPLWWYECAHTHEIGHVRFPLWSMGVPTTTVQPGKVQLCCYSFFYLSTKTHHFLVNT